MVELTKSMLNFSWAQSLFGAQHLLNLFAAPGPSGSKGAAAFDAVAYTTADQLEGIFKDAFQVGDQLQRMTIDTAFDFVTRDGLNPIALVRLTGMLVRQSLDTVQFILSPRALRLAWQEFRDKLRVFQWVRNVQSLLHLSPDVPLPLTELVERSYALGDFPALWAVEGMGHYYADTFWGRDQDPRDILTSAEAQAVPDKSLTMLHAGIGLSFAQHLLETLTPETPGPEVRAVVERFLRLCRQNSRPGYVGAAMESLGLVARVFHPRELVPVIDQQLAEVDEEAQAYFWHGVGRAIYFSPTYFLPVGRSPWRAVEMTFGEAPHELGQLNALAGLAWAVTLVNMPQPQIMEAVIKAHGQEFSQSGAFANGISSSIIMRYDTTPDAPFISAFCQHQPAGSDPSLPQLWNSLVRRPCEDALQRYYGILKQRQRLGEVFREQSLADLVARLR
jgi:hypothetical protein